MNKIFFLLCISSLLLLQNACSRSENMNKAVETLVQSNASDNQQSPPVVPGPPDTYDETTGIDPLLSQTWHLNNTGQTSFATEGGTEGEDINTLESFGQNISGKEVKIAISDNGTQIYHPDLVRNSWFGFHRNYSYENSDYWNSDPTPVEESDVAAHGTAVAGIVAAMYDNAKGSRGIAYQAKFGAFLYIGTGFSLAKSMDQANGPFDIFNYSYGRNTCIFQDVSDFYIDQLRYGVTTLRNDKGSIYVKAAGNEYISSLSDCVDGEDGYYFGNATLEEDNAYPYFILVGANTAHGYSAGYSTPGPNLWLSAPGGNFGLTRPAIVTTDLTGCDQGFSNSENGYNQFDQGADENENCDYTSTMNGTSAAAPMVTAATALILEARGELSWRDIKYILALSARKIDPSRDDRQTHPFPSESLAGYIYELGWKSNSAGFHYHNWYGFGALDIDNAIRIAQTYPVLSDPIVETNWRNESQELDLEIPDYSSDGLTQQISVQDNLIIEALQLQLEVEHPYASELGIVLTSPSGMQSNLLYINSGIVQEGLSNNLLLSNAFLGETAQGNWTLRIVDAKKENTGKLKKWKLNFWGHYADANEEQRKATYYQQDNTVTATSDIPGTSVETVTAINTGARNTSVTSQSESKTKAQLNISNVEKANSLIRLFQLNWENTKKKNTNLDVNPLNLEKVLFADNKYIFILSDEKNNYLLTETSTLALPKNTDLHFTAYSSGTFYYLSNEKTISHVREDGTVTQTEFEGELLALQVVEGKLNLWVREKNQDEKNVIVNLRQEGPLLVENSTVETNSTKLYSVLLKSDGQQVYFTQENDHHFVLKTDNNGKLLDKRLHPTGAFQILAASFGQAEMVILYMNKMNERIFFETFELNSEKAVNKIEVPGHYRYEPFLIKDNSLYYFKKSKSQLVMEKAQK